MLLHGNVAGIVDAAERLADLVLATAPANGNDSTSSAKRSAA